MPAQFLPTKAGPRLPDIAGSVLKGVQLGLYARQLKVEEKNAENRYALALKTEKRLNDSATMRSAQFAQGLEIQKDQEARVKELHPSRVSKAEAEAKLAGQEAGVLERGLRISKGLLDQSKISQDIKESEARITRWDNNTKAKAADIKVTTYRNNLKDTFSFLKAYNEATPPQKANMLGLAKGSDNLQLKSALAGLDPNAKKPLDFSTEAKTRASLAQLFENAGDPKNAALIRLSGVLFDLSGVVSDNFEGVSKDIVTRLTDITKKLQTPKQKAKFAEEKAEVATQKSKVAKAKQDFINDVWTAAVRSGYSRKKAGDLLNNKKAMDVIRRARKSGMSFEEILKEIPR